MEDCEITACWLIFIFHSFIQGVAKRSGNPREDPLLNRFAATAGFTLLVLVTPILTSAQTPTPPPAQAPNPADTPNIRVGAVIYADYTFMQAPTITDADGNEVRSNSFNVGRSYINITGNISHVFNFRITPDITRETGTGSSLNGSLVFRIKYAFLQANLDDWMGAGSWARLGIQQTPIIELEENIYRYRFQGQVFVEREGFLTSSDAGASFHTNIKQDYGEVHVGIYNGEGYSRVEANNTKAFQIRGSVRPFAKRGALRGLRVHGFYDADSYVEDAEKSRAMFMTTFEHPRVNAGFDYLVATDQTLSNAVKKDAEGFSFWITPRAANGWEGLLRVDQLEPDDRAEADRTRTIAGIAYWFPHQGNVSAALMLDYEYVKLNTETPSIVPPAPTQKRIAVHGLISF
jgi:hypothetical protein